MSKILEIKSCYYCKHYLSPFHCELLKRSVRSKGIDKECPLPDKKKVYTDKDIKDIHEMTKIEIKATEKRVVEDVIIIAHDCMDGFAYIPVETFKDKLKQKYGVK